MRHGLAQSRMDCLSSRGRSRKVVRGWVLSILSLFLCSPVFSLSSLRLASRRLTITILSGLRDLVDVLAGSMVCLCFFRILRESALMSLTRVSAFRFLDAIVDGDVEPTIVIGFGVGVGFFASCFPRRFTITILRGLRKLAIVAEGLCCFGAGICVSSSRASAFRFLDAIVVVLVALMNEVGAMASSCYQAEFSSQRTPWRV